MYIRERCTSWGSKLETDIDRQVAVIIGSEENQKAKYSQLDLFFSDSADVTSHVTTVYNLGQA